MKTIGAIILILATMNVARSAAELDELYGGVKPKSCLEIKYHNPSINTNGVYTIYTKKTHIPFKVYCDFKTDAPYIWTLVESFTRKMGRWGAKLPNAWRFQRPYTINAPYNDDNPTNWGAYRLSRTMMLSIDSSNTTNYFRVTCNFNDYATNKTKDIDRDNYLRENTCDLPIVNQQAFGCRYFDYVVVRGYACVRCYFPFWIATNYHPTFLASHTVKYCGRYKFPGTSPSHQESDFAHYNGYSTQHSCSSFADSTANWWFGGLYLPEHRSTL